jgi:hypothetical protein
MRLGQIFLQLTSITVPAAALLRNGFLPHVEAVREMHHKISQRTISRLYDTALSTIVSIIGAACSPMKVTVTIAQSLMSYVHSRNTRITALRATPVHLFNDEENSFPLLEWTEEDDTKSVAIFHFEDDEKLEEGSWLMHSGRLVGEVKSTRRWKQSRIDWNVANIEHLKILFGVAQHMLGLLEWPSSEAFKIYCNMKSNTMSVTEYVPKRNLR